MAQTEISILVTRGLVCALILWPAPALALTLEDGFRAALARSELVETQRELLEQQEELYNQARGSLLPTVSAVGQEFWQETPSTAAGSSALSPQPTGKITAQQPLFRGFREFAGIRQQRRLVEAQDAAWKAAVIQLYKDVATSFYTVVALEKDLSNVREEIGLYDRRVQDLNARVKIGRSRVSEVLNVQSLRANLVAQSESIDGQIRTQRALFSFLTGLSGAYPVQDTEQLPSAPLPLETYLASVEARPDVRADVKRVAGADENIWVQKGAHLPSADLFGNYYFYRTGTLRDVSWDVQVVLTLPLYAGGVLQSKVRQAESQKDEAELAMSRTRRLAEQEIRLEFEQYESDRKLLKAYSDAFELARRNYQEQSKEYKLGLVNNLDVLAALTTFDEAQRALDRVKASVKLDFARLEASAARRPAAAPLEVKK